MLKPLGFILALFACQLSYAQQAYVKYPIGPGDLVKINVLDLEEIAGDYRIDTSGHVNLPYLGRLFVKDKSLIELQDLLINELKKEYLNNPQVLIEIKEYNYRPISVIGAVNNPGRLNLIDLDLDLLGAITQAGGVLENAGRRIFVIRPSSDGVGEKLELDLSRLLNEGTPHLNIPIFPGDTVMVPVKKPFMVTVMGEVNKPGEYEFDPDSKVTILRVIAIAGGLTDFARPNRVGVRREKGGGSEDIRLDIRAIQANRKPDFAIQHNDLVIVK